MLKCECEADSAEFVVHIVAVISIINTSYQGPHFTNMV